MLDATKRWRLEHTDTRTGRGAAPAWSPPRGNHTSAPAGGRAITPRRLPNSLRHGVPRPPTIISGIQIKRVLVLRTLHYAAPSSRRSVPQTHSLGLVPGNAHAPLPLSRKRLWPRYLPTVSYSWHAFSGGRRHLSHRPTAAGPSESAPPRCYPPPLPAKFPAAPLQLLAVGHQGHSPGGRNKARRLPAAGHGLHAFTPPPSPLLLPLGIR